VSVESCIEVRDPSLIVDGDAAERANLAIGSFYALIVAQNASAVRCAF
jgi:hypothetical protein